MKPLSILLTLLLTGCAVTVERYVVCTLDGKTAIMTTMSGDVGAAVKLSGADAKMICKEK